MRKGERVLYAAVVIGLVSAAAGAGTIAYFSDTETAPDNALTAGTVEIAVDGQERWNRSFHLRDVKPGTVRFINLTVTNTGENPARVSTRLDVTNRSDGFSTEPEREEDPDGSRNDVDAALTYGLTANGSVLITPAKGVTVTDVDGLEIPLGVLDPGVGTLEPGETRRIHHRFRMRPETTNWAQGDVLTFDLELVATQAAAPPAPAPRDPTPFADQPDNDSSELVTHNGSYVTDRELANMVNGTIARAGYANIIMVFGECYGGGMMDDMAEALNGTGDVAMMSSSWHNETSYGDPNSATDPTDPEKHFTREVADEMARTGPGAPNASEMFRNARGNDVSAPGNRFDRLGEDTEHPQYRALGNGSDAKLGKHADGTDVASKHAVLFAGDVDRQRHWNTLRETYDALRAHGYADGDIDVLYGDGSGAGATAGAPPVDGPGTEKALSDALNETAQEMNESEQLVLWFDDHGSHDRHRNVSRVIPTPNRTTVPGDWGFSDAVLTDMARDPGNEPFAAVVVDPDPSLPRPRDLFLRNLSLRLNGRVLPREQVAGTHWEDNTPDLDGYVVRFRADEEDVGSENELELEWTGDPEEFRPYRLERAELNTGAIDVVPRRDILDP